MRKGDKYNWKGCPERLVYLGKSGFWHKFALIEKPWDVWCEVIDSDLHMLEETKTENPAEPNKLNTAFHQLTQMQKERDTYRDLCGELLEAAKCYSHYMPKSSAKDGGAARHSGMLIAADALKDAITKAEKIMGDANG